jgi:hypothetical protein
MEIGTMSAEELAQSFSNQNQTQQPSQQQQQQSQTAVVENFNQQVIETESKSSEDFAKEFEQNKVETNNSDGTKKTPEQIAEEIAVKAEVNKNISNKTKLDDSFKQGLDKLFKENKLNPYSDGTETGYVVPETFEEVLDLIEDNKKSWIESSKAKDREELVNEVLATKSPAWQFLIQNSEMYKDPADLIPLITAVQNQEYSNSLDPSEPEDQEKIIRASLSIQGLPPQTIEEEIVDLKDRNKLESRATALKPVLDKYNEERTSEILQEKQKEELKTQEFWNVHYQNLENTVFKSKDLDGVKLKNEHKQLIASALIPDKDLGGLPIYTLIDNLIAKGNFTALSKIVLLSEDEKLFDTYFLSEKAGKKAESVQRVLRQSGINSNSTDFEQDNGRVKSIKKSSYGYFG